MSPVSSTLERDALDAAERRLTEQGYTVVRQPLSESLPNFLGGWEPDAIATGKHPNLLIEVIVGRGAANVEATKVKQLQQLLEGQADWRLEVVYAAPSTPLPSASTLHAIRTRYQEIRRLAPLDRPATLVMAWALLEAAARAAMPDRAAKPLTPATTAELLTSLGRVTQADADRLRTAARARNLIVHGDVATDVPVELLNDVLRIVSDLTGDSQQ
jgi:hypothetical protein